MLVAEKVKTLILSTDQTAAIRQAEFLTINLNMYEAMKQRMSNLTKEKVFRYIDNFKTFLVHE